MEHGCLCGGGSQEEEEEEEEEVEYKKGHTAKVKTKNSKKNLEHLV